MTLMVKAFAEKIIKLNREEVAIFEEFAPPMSFEQGPVVTLYKGQVPISAYVIYSGNIHLKNKTVRLKVKSPSLIFLCDSFFKNPIPYDVEVLSQSSIGFLDRSSILEIISQSFRSFDKNVLLNKKLQSIKLSQD